MKNINKYTKLLEIRNLKLEIPCLREEGSSLVETLMYTGIFLILLVVLLQIFTSVIDVQLESQSTSSVAIDGRYLLLRLTYDIQRAQVITSPGLGATSSALHLTINGADYGYSIASSSMQLVNPSGTDVLSGYGSTISNLKFTTLGNSGGKNDVMVSFTIFSKTQKSSGSETRSFETTVGTR